MLYIVPTPIGNLSDITLRALETLKNIDAIICEDTRRTSLLLNHFQIKKPMIILNDFNEFKTLPNIIERLRLGQNLALVSDAGTPLISDPGYKLVRECIKEGVTIDSLPGPVSPIVALTLSGLPPDKFSFVGYFPEKSGQRANFIRSLAEIYKIQKQTFIAFVAPHKLPKTLEEMKENIGDLKITLAKELTKLHQKVEEKTISEWTESFKKQPPKGEYIMLLRFDS